MTGNKSIGYYVIISLLILLPLSSCGPTYKAARTQRQTERRLDQRKQEGERTLLQGQKQHINAQSRETRKRMKQTRRHSQRLNNNRRIPFYKRWYYSLRR